MSELSQLKCIAYRGVDDFDGCGNPQLAAASFGLANH
jgi:hypothetical protein